MASPKQKQTQRTRGPVGGRVEKPKPTSNGAAEPEVVEPLWLVKAIGLTLVAALVCGYLALCLLFYQGQWQLVLHPSKRPDAEVKLDGVATETVRFGIDESATPQLAGVYIPAAVGTIPASVGTIPAAAGTKPVAVGTMPPAVTAPGTGALLSTAGPRYGNETILYLPSGDGQLADADATLQMLHNLRLNVFAFDYRGYGASLKLNPAQPHPNEQRMAEDANSAWQYLTVSRGLKPSQIIPFGTGVGAALAAGLAERHAEVPALIVDAPRPDLLAAIRRDPRTSSLPVGALFHERFAITGALASLKTPKFLIVHEGAEQGGVEEVAAVRALARSAADPKFTLSLGAKSSPAMLPEALGRFLDQCLPR